jgi:hypothetical protein
MPPEPISTSKFVRQVTFVITEVGYNIFGAVRWVFEEIAALLIEKTVCSYFIPSCLAINESKPFV